MTIAFQTQHGICAAIVLAAFASTAGAQIAQEKPELCGMGGTVAVPAGVTAAPNLDSMWGSVLAIKGDTGTSEIPFDGRHVEQVCPLSGNRLLAFGQMAPAAYYAAIIDLKDAKLVDGFRSWGAPVISPDQRWLIMKAFYPEHSDAPFSDEYLLYDLTRDRAGNTKPGVTQYTEEMRGRVVYPAVDRGTPFESFNLPPNEQHNSRSTWYYWASDSSAVLFADSVEAVVSVVLVRTDSDPPRTYVHAITPSEVCEQGPDGKIAGGPGSTSLMLSDADVGPEQGGDRTITARFSPLAPDEGGCRTKQAVLHESDFKPAPLEAHPPIIRNKPVITIDPPRKK
jgi:hypothetical protein